MTGAFVSPDSNSATIYTRVHDPVAADLTATPISSTQIHVVVAPPPNSANAGCEISRSTDGSNWANIKEFSAVYSLTNTVSSGVTYFYRCRYINGSGFVTAYSTSVSATGGAVVPSPPTDLSVQAGNGQLTVGWTARPGARASQAFHHERRPYDIATAHGFFGFISIRTLTHEWDNYYYVASVVTGGVEELLVRPPALREFRSPGRRCS
jgi:hypothetical protein